ncbi:MAG: DUF2141 domain-containing protein [Alphaproteobacteria bacterium]
MTSISRCLGLAILLAAAGPAEAADLSVNVTGLRSGDGDVQFGLYATPETFPMREGRLAGAAVKAKAKGVQAVFPDLAPGTYAVAVYHDENGNARFDQGFLGIPLEGYAFSNGASAFLGPPDFAEAAITVGTGAAEITIRMNY